ncbi:hypothetical protein JK359_29155 [Streptomyces actinomycinicus]|uniref:Uncharacterized protein n=1 Tax=Streptomyces actinomycinicus TaxID=1695166 RepID=A0A937EP37_9ACTN|nr:hypothetical protein [Streptomyces actinomycinicus]MBL1085988.1 hypothetical protein [Streptomyces actinomycinicus]
MRSPTTSLEAAVAVAGNAPKKWEKAHAFALSPPGITVGPTDAIAPIRPVAQTGASAS